jgi:hypothetical protein
MSLWAFDGVQDLAIIFATVERVGRDGRHMACLADDQSGTLACREDFWGLPSTGARPERPPRSRGLQHRAML